jgi:hypothetical protein
MRAKGGAEDFLPIKPAKKAPEEANKKMGKRLVREEDEEEEVRGFKFKTKYLVLHYIHIRTLGQSCRSG